jgi:FKBP-type peptidyl-prolyl cis-trans isomerase FklB
MRIDLNRFLITTAAGVFFCGMALAQQSSAPSTQQPSTSKPATTMKKPAASTAAKPVTLDTDKDKQSYAIGLNIGKSMKKDGVDVNSELLAKGIRDAVSGATPLLTDEQVGTVLNQLQVEVRKHQQEAFDAAKQKNKEEGDAFLAANKSKPDVVTLPSGLQYKVIQNGDGPKPTAADTVVCNYRGTLVNGTEFDSSYKSGKPATFPVSRVIKGWTEALQLMPVGSKWQLYVPPTLAYGDRGTPNGGPIGPEETLIFDVELVSIQPKPQPKLEGVPGGPQGQSLPRTQPQAQPQAQPQSQPQTPQSAQPQQKQQ